MLSIKQNIQEVLDKNIVTEEDINSLFTSDNESVVCKST